MSIYNKLFEWQAKLVDKFKSRTSFGLFLDMGLGKTPTASAFAEVNNCTKVLLISINAKATETIADKGSWPYWLSQSDINYTFKSKNAEIFDNNVAECMTVNYESLFERGARKTQKVTIKHNIVNFINSCKGHNVAIIVDESHKMKNLQSQQTQAIMKIKKECQRVAKRVYSYLLTGTPFTTGYIDLYSQLKMLGCDMNKNEFVDNFCVKGNIPGLLGWQQPIVSYKNLNSLFTLLHQYAVTIKSEEVASLPPMVFVNHITAQSADFTAFISEKMKVSDIINIYKSHKLTPDDKLLSSANTKINNPFFRNIAYPDLKWLAETAGTNWLRARQLSIGFQGNAEEAIWFDRSRLNQLEKFLATNEENYVLFYNFTPELLEIYDICDRLGYNVDVYCGDIKSLTFYEKFSNLSDSEKLVTKKNIILANFASGSTGKNWQEYSHCILFSCPIYSAYEQGIKRINRTGQKYTTIYHKFYQDNWLDRGMNEALEQKIEYSSTMFESDLKRVQILFGGENND